MNAMTIGYKLAFHQREYTVPCGGRDQCHDISTGIGFYYDLINYLEFVKGSVQREERGVKGGINLSGILWECCAFQIEPSAWI